MKKIYHSNLSQCVESRGGTLGLYRLLFWNKRKKIYVFPPFVLSLTLRLGVEALRPLPLRSAQIVRDALLLRWPSMSIIITPYPN